MVLLLSAFIVSLVATLILIRRSKLRPSRTIDTDVSGPQKFHVTPVPRVGGISIYLGVLVAMGVLCLINLPLAQQGLLLLACGSPAFVAGLSEDITKNVSPSRRLLFTAISAALAAWLADSVITRTDIPGLDAFVSVPIGAMIATVFAVSGVANSINIIDGFNGLASMCGVIILASLAYVGFQVGDQLVVALALAGVGAVLGFFIWNFPAGLIFLGDGGAYFLGFFAAEIAVLLLHRNPDVSPMFPLLLCIYPVFETLFSIYRRRFLQSVPPSMPDGIHLHSLIYRRVIRWAVGNHSAKALTRRNSLTSPYLWLLCMTATMPAVIFWNNTPVLMLFILVFGVTYTYLYWRIVRFRSPRWLIIRRRPVHEG